MIVHLEIHYSPAAGVAEVVEAVDLPVTDALTHIIKTLEEQLANAKDEDEFTANVFVVDMEDS